MSASGPLAGLRVLEIAGVGPGPHCAMLLADMGEILDVLRIDRVRPRYRVHARTDLLNRGRRSAALDLKQSRAVEAMLALAERADVLLESRLSPRRDGTAGARAGNPARA